jgi:hypothetical protein
MKKFSGSWIFALGAIIVLVFSASRAGSAGELYPLPFERYQQNWCKDHNGATNVRIPDGTTADCITSAHVVEFEAAGKWKEAIGRALYCSLETGKKAGIVLVVEDKAGLEYWNRLKSTIDHFKLPIDTWKID